MELRMVEHVESTIAHLVGNATTNLVIPARKFKIEISHYLYIFDPKKVYRIDQTYVRPDGGVYISIMEVGQALVKEGIEEPSPFILFNLFIPFIFSYDILDRSYGKI